MPSVGVRLLSRNGYERSQLFGPNLRQCRCASISLMVIPLKSVSDIGPLQGACDQPSLTRFAKVVGFL
jgi:hypothetical protein